MILGGEGTVGIESGMLGDKWRIGSHTEPFPYWANPDHIYQANELFICAIQYACSEEYIGFRNKPLHTIDYAKKANSFGNTRRLADPDFRHLARIGATSGGRYIFGPARVGPTRMRRVLLRE